MRHTNADFLNALANTPAPVYMRFDASSAGGSMIILGQTPYAISINVPATYNFARSPTKELLDRLTELKARYATVWLPGSRLPTENAFQNAKDFILTLPLNRIANPAIHVASDGEGNFSFYGSKEGREPILGDDIPVKDGVPKDLV